MDEQRIPFLLPLLDYIILLINIYALGYTYGFEDSAACCVTQEK